MDPKAVFLSIGEEIELEEWRSKILVFLKKAETANFQEISQELEARGATKEVLSSILWVMESENEIKSEPLSIPIAGGLVLTKIYKLRG